jgi:thermostable 8-oxoguanine DNA glycosylase
MQTMYAIINGIQRSLKIPRADELLLPDILWGAFDEILTPAYWLGQAWQHGELGTFKDQRLGRTLAEELVACMLGGYGMPAELGLAAYSRVRDFGLIEGAPSSSLIEEALSEPFLVQGRLRHYRFPKQKARYVSACLERLPSLNEISDDVEFRNQLSGLPGIGLKTSSWVVRNHRNSNSVAIIDVHILRAGQLMRLFKPELDPQRHYLELEKRFIQFSNAINVSAAMLDGLIWHYMRRFSKAAVLCDEKFAQNNAFDRGQSATQSSLSNHLLELHHQ